MNPEHESARKALRWISDMRKDGTDLTTEKLIDQAGLKFDLNPGEQEALLTWLLDSK
jgi:hypothetical protein